MYFLSFAYNIFSVFRTRDESEMVSSDDDSSDDENERLITA